MSSRITNRFANLDASIYDKRKRRFGKFYENSLISKDTQRRANVHIYTSVVRCMCFHMSAKVYVREQNIPVQPLICMYACVRKNDQEL